MRATWPPRARVVVVVVVAAHRLVVMVTARLGVLAGAALRFPFRPIISPHAKLPALDTNCTELNPTHSSNQALSAQTYWNLPFLHASRRNLWKL
jgi:hypothetical protein